MKKKTTFGDGEVKSTITLVRTYTVKALPERAAEAQRVYEQIRAIMHQTHKRYHENANGRPIVRKSFSGYPCLFKGVLIRETPQYYIYAENYHREGGDIANCKQFRIHKNNAHLEPCKSCTDHPQTHYQTGFDN